MQDNVTRTCGSCGNALKDGGVDWYCDTSGCDEELTLVNAVAAANRTRLASTTAQLVEAAEDNAWREARELVRGTNADLCKTGEQAYRIIQKGITDAVNNRSLRTLKGRVAAHRESQP